MARGRRADDWDRDLAAARVGERQLLELFHADARVRVLTNRADGLELDFHLLVEDMEVEVELKEKRQPYSRFYATLAPSVQSADLFIVDEVAFRRLIFAGGRAFLLVHDLVARRWVLFDVFALTLEPHTRFYRWGDRGAGQFRKGKMLYDLAGGSQHVEDPIGLLIDAVRNIEHRRTAIEPLATRVPLHGIGLFRAA
jgi:hypothetical protein